MANSYTYLNRQDGDTHGWLSVSDGGQVLATKEHWSSVEEIERVIPIMEKHECKPKQMIPLGDPRWDTHCQGCGQPTQGEKTAYYAGQYHLRCYWKYKPHKKNG